MNVGKATKVSLRRELQLFDVTNLVVGAIIGADIYVAAAIGSSLLGPASLLAWVCAGLLAILIALYFANSSALTPSVGGLYAYVKEAGSALMGFMAGWALLHTPGSKGRIQTTKDRQPRTLSSLIPLLLSF